MNPESEQTKGSLPLIIPIAKLYCYEIESNNAKDTHFFTPAYFDEHPPNLNQEDTLNYINISKFDKTKSFNDQWLPIIIRMPYDENLLFSIVKKWERSDDVYIKFPINQNKFNQKALVNGIAKKDIINHHKLESYLLIRFHINPSFFPPSTYIFPC